MKKPPHQPWPSLLNAVLVFAILLTSGLALLEILDQWAQHDIRFGLTPDVQEKGFRNQLKILNFEWILLHQIKIIGALSFIGLCYLVKILLLPYFAYTRRKLAKEPLDLFRFAAAVFLLFPAVDLADFYWHGMGAYFYLWVALFYFLLCLVYLLLEEAILKLLPRT